LKALADRIAFKQSEFEAKYKDAGKGNIYDTLAVMGAHFKYQINAKQTSLKEFAALQVTMKKQLENGRRKN
jgi:hypothetical protein